MTRTDQLRNLLQQPEILVMPCCHDGLSAMLIEQAGFPITFMSGFAVSASKIARPDTGLISYGEMVDQGRAICQAVTIPVLGDGDTGYGNAVNVKRTVQGYGQAGFSCIMIEDQVSPKRCGHTQGKQVVGRHEAAMRIQAAVDARDEGTDILIMARTDARTTLGFQEALDRCQDFSNRGADIIFMEAPESVAEMEQFCQEVATPCMANMIQNGKTPLLSQQQLQAMGFKIVAYPLTLLSRYIESMQNSLRDLRNDTYPAHQTFNELQQTLGFPQYYSEEKRYS
ncbi:MAG: isocitrate lyase/PEP mutase family protein [Spirochaetales bacterium]|jgi:2-methylisocitrate lyase-like PEP mutase family enzyme|nr:isocitrate lyase/PEP mutase family protein [Spirochaetales bacterium]